LIGGNFRLFEINSAGTIFIDTTGKPFWNYEYGAFVQMRRGFWEERLQLTAAVRFDQRQYVLRGRLTPRLMATYAVDKKGHHVVRGGYQMGFRNPISEALFIRLQTDALLIGALPQTDRALGIAGTNNYTLTSVKAYREAIARGVPPEQAAQLLRSVPINGLRPEIVHAFEVGTRHQLFEQRLLIDLSYAYNRYKDMHGNIRIYGPADPTQQLSPADVNSNRLSPLVRALLQYSGHSPSAVFHGGTSVSAYASSKARRRLHLCPGLGPGRGKELRPRAYCELQHASPSNQLRAYRRRDSWTLGLSSVAPVGACVLL
jgi:outer membrane receptor protein involved in Fe transport